MVLFVLVSTSLARRCRLRLLRRRIRLSRFGMTEKSVTSGAGVRTAVRGPGQKVAARAAVIDVFDADNDEIKERIVIERFEVSPNGDRVMVNSDIAGFPFVGEIIGEYIAYSTDLEDDGS